MRLNTGSGSGYRVEGPISARILPYNRAMSDIEILVPFALPPPALANDLLRGLSLPALATLLSRGTETSRTTRGADGPDAGFDRALPHEAWLARHFGLADGLHAGGSPPVAVALMHAMQLPAEPGYWFIVQPVHYHVARDHLVLTDPRRLMLAEADARVLFAAALPSFEEAGLTLRYGSADTWFARADAFADLHTATPDAACGHNIDIWMPQGASARAWRKLQNLVQMDWHGCPVNDVRAAAGATPVNSVWLWAGASAPARSQPTVDALFGFEGWYAAFGPLAAASHRLAGPAELLASQAARKLLLLDDLTGPALNSDWAEWLARLQALEQRWFAPLLDALAQGRTGSLSLLCSDGADLREWTASRTSLRKFWRKPVLSGLLP